MTQRKKSERTPDSSAQNAHHPRRLPRQERSRRMVDDLLEGAARVLSARGVEGLTTNHVAKATGVSVGSLYQYFPNKASLLLALHQREAEQAWAALDACLVDGTQSPARRIELALGLAYDSQTQARVLHAALEKEQASARDAVGFDGMAVQIATRLTTLSPHADASRRAAYAAWLALAAIEGLGQESAHDESGAAPGNDDLPTKAAWVRYTTGAILGVLGIAP